MKNKLLFLIYCVIGCLFTFPLFMESISSIFLIVLTVLVSSFLIYTKSKMVFTKEMFIYTLPFFILLCTNLFAVHSKIDWNSISIGLLFLIFPIVFFNIPTSLFKNLEKKFLYILKFSCLIISFYFIIYFLIHYNFADFFKESYNESVFRDYVYHNSFFKVHPTYLSLFINVGIIHSLVRMHKELKYFNLFYIFFSLLVILLLTSRLMMVFSIFSISYVFFIKRVIKRAYFVIIAASLFIGILFLPGIKSRFIETYQDFNTPPKGLYFNSTNIRKSIVDCSFEILKENYLRGVGFSNIQVELNACYKANYDSVFYENHNYMTHNYLMYIFIGSGIFGFLTLLLYLFTIIKRCLKINNIILNLSLLNFILLLFVEDFFCRHFGLYFFSLLIFSYFRFNEYIDEESVLNEQ